MRHTGGRRRPPRGPPEGRGGRRVDGVPKGPFPFFVELFSGKKLAPGGPSGAKENAGGQRDLPTARAPRPPRTTTEAPTSSKHGREPGPPPYLRATMASTTK